MTEQSSCKSFFGTYLRYRIKSQRTNLILSCILNLLTLPLFIVGYISSQNNEYSQLYYFGTFFSILCGVFLIVLAVIGAIFSFDFYHRKDLTDTIGCLPLTYGQRFFGDLLGGYIANVLPSVPIGLAAAVFAAVYKGFEEFDPDRGITKLGFILGMAVSLFFALTFTYLFAVLIVSACGKVLHSVLFTVFGIAVLTGTVAGIGGCFGIGMLGVDPADYMSKALSFIPPVGSIADLYLGTVFLSGSPLELFGGNLWYYSGRRFFTALDVPNIVWFVILGAGITLGAYGIGKCRKTEKTGSAFAVRPAFYVISAFSCAAGVFITVIYNVKDQLSFGTGLPKAAGVGAILCIVSIVMYLPKKKLLPRCILCGMIAVGASVGAAALLKETNSFGAAYLPENTKEIEYIRLNYDYYITDKSDMKQYIKNHNDILREGRDKLVYGHRYTIEYKTADGEVTERSYHDLNGSATDVMRNNERILPGYGRHFFEMLVERNAHRAGCRIIKGNDAYEIPEQSYEEFLETLSREASEKYDPEAEVYASVEFLSWGSDMPFYIGENLEDTISLLENIKDTAGPDPKEIVWKIDYRTEGRDSNSLKIIIRNRDMDDPLVNELIGLLKGEYEADPLDEDFVAYFKSTVSETGWAYYYVPQESSKRVLEIMTELVIREIESQT